MNRRKFMAGLALLPTIPFLGLVKAESAESVDGVGGPHKDWRPTEQGQFKINARMFIAHVKDGMKTLIFELATEKNLQLFKHWLEETVSKLTPNIFSSVAYVASYNEESNLEVLLIMGTKTKAVNIHNGLGIIPTYRVTLRTGRGGIEQDGII